MQTREGGVFAQDGRIGAGASSGCEEGAGEARLAEALRRTALAICSRLDFNQLLDEILEQVGRVICFDSASIALLEGDQFRLTALRGFRHPERLLGVTFASRPTPDTCAPNLLAMQRRKAIRMGNVPREYPRFVHPEDGTILSWMTIPLCAREQDFGTLNLDSYRLDHFSAQDQLLGEIFAAQVSVALENARLYAEVERASRVDHLTQLFTRKHFYDTAGMADPPGTYSILMVDLDFFRDLNETYGHPGADRLLQAAARVCLEHMRQRDLAARFGGDEFVILLSDTALEDARRVAFRLRDAIAEQVTDLEGRPVRVTASVGVASRGRGDALGEVIHRADRALFDAKRLGRNQVGVDAFELN